MAAMAAKLLIAMNDSSRRPRSPYPGLVASTEVRRSLLIGPLVPPRLLSLRCCQRRQPSDLILGQTVATVSPSIKPVSVNLRSHARCASRSLRHPSAKQLANFAQQPIKLHRLGIETASAFSRSPASAWADRPMTGMSRVSGLLFTPCRFPAVDDRHLQVHQDKVRPLGSRNLASFFAILGDQHFELIGELKPHLEHVSVVLVVFDVENTEHRSPSLGRISLRIRAAAPLEHDGRPICASRPRLGSGRLLVANPGPVVLAHSHGGSGRLRD